MYSPMILELNRTELPLIQEGQKFAIYTHVAADSTSWERGKVILSGEK